MKSIQERTQAQIQAIKTYYPNALANPEITHTDNGVEIRYEIGLSEAAEVILSLVDTGNEDEGLKCFDLEVIIGNGDAVGPIYMSAAFQCALESFYEQGLNTRFGKLTGE